MPHACFSDAVDTGKLTALRSLINEKGEYRVSLSDLLIVAVGKALQKYPLMNVSLQGDRIIRYESVNIGTAVAGEAGLIVPVVKNVQEKSLRQIAAETRGRGSSFQGPRRGGFGRKNTVREPSRCRTSE